MWLADRDSTQAVCRAQESSLLLIPAEPPGLATLSILWYWHSLEWSSEVALQILQPSSYRANTASHSSLLGLEFCFPSCYSHCYVVGCKYRDEDGEGAISRIHVGKWKPMSGAGSTQLFLYPALSILGTGDWFSSLLSKTNPPSAVLRVSVLGQVWMRYGSRDTAMYPMIPLLVIAQREKVSPLG